MRLIVTVGKKKNSNSKTSVDCQNFGERYDKIWEDAKGVVLMITKMENIGASYIIVCSCVGGYPYSFTIVQMCMLLGRETFIMFDIVLSWRSLLLTGVQHQQLLENVRPTRKGPRRCANQLVGPYSHVWTMCRRINYTSKLSVRIAAVRK